MGQKQSKDELLYQQVNYGNTEGIKALRSEGAGLEWIDQDGKTPLIVSCLNPDLCNVAKTLIELGANVNAYRPGRHAGTPLHHAAKRGLEQIVKLLLSNGANALLMNDDCQTPLDVARAKGYTNVVRTIEGHLCLFSGWLRELYGPGFMELLAPQLLSKKVWVVILPCGSRNSRRPFKLELAMYARAEDAQPRMLIPLWKANLEEPNFNQPDPAAIISDISKIRRRWRRRRAIKYCQEARRTRIKLAPVQESGKQQLQLFCNACKGIPQVMNSSFPFNAVPATAPPATEDDLATAINASMQFPPHERPSHRDSDTGSTTSGSSTSSSSHEESCFNGASTSQEPCQGKCEIIEAVSSGSPAQLLQSYYSNPSVVHVDNPSLVTVPSAPAADAAVDNGPIHYPSIDISDLSSPIVETVSASKKSEKKEDDVAASSCTICLDAPLEGACIPCGHMAGCMSCLNEIKAKKWGCPMCRSKINQVVRIYAV